MNKHIPLGEWILNYLSGEYDSPELNKQIEAGWFDWFCDDSELLIKTKKLGIHLMQIVKSKKIDLINNYVFFKNNCPGVGNLYDDFRICDIHNDDVIYTITPKDGNRSSFGKSSVWGKENNFKGALVEGTWDDVKKFFNCDFSNMEV